MDGGVRDKGNGKESLSKEQFQNEIRRRRSGSERPLKKASSRRRGKRSESERHIFFKLSTRRGRGSGIKRHVK